MPPLVELGCSLHGTSGHIGESILESGDCVCKNEGSVDCSLSCRQCSVSGVDWSSIYPLLSLTLPVQALCNLRPAIALEHSASTWHVLGTPPRNVIMCLIVKKNSQVIHIQAKNV